jgi:hypothetical protein
VRLVLPKAMLCVGVGLGVLGEEFLVGLCMCCELLRVLRLLLMNGVSQCQPTLFMLLHLFSLPSLQSHCHRPCSIDVILACVSMTRSWTTRLASNHFQSEQGLSLVKGNQGLPRSRFWRVCVRGLCRSPSKEAITANHDRR